MSNLDISNKTKDKNFIDDSHKDIMRRIEILKLINSYKNNFIQTYAHNSPPRLPILNQSKSQYHNIFKKVEKSNFLSNNRSKKNLLDKKNNINYTDLNNIHQIKNKTFRNKIKIQKNIDRNYNQQNKINTNYFNSFNLLPYNIKSYSNKAPNTYSNNRIRIYKIKNLENSKNIVDEFSKVNNEYCFLKKNYNIRRNNINMDIYNLINKKNNNIFSETLSKTTKI